MVLTSFFFMGLRLMSLLKYFGNVLFRVITCLIMLFRFETLFRTQRFARQNAAMFSACNCTLSHFYRILTYNSFIARVRNDIVGTISLTDHLIDKYISSTPHFVDKLFYCQLISLTNHFVDNSPCRQVNTSTNIIP